MLTTLKGGTGNGLEIMLDIQQDEYLPVWGDTGEQYIKKDISDVFLIVYLLLKTRHLIHITKVFLLGSYQFKSFRQKVM